MFILKNSNWSKDLSANPMALGSSVCLWILSIGFYTIIEIVIVFVLTCWLGFQGSDRRQGGADCSQEASERPPPSSSPCVLLGCCSIM